MLLVRRNCGCCGTSVAAVDGRHFDAAVRRKAGATEKLVLRCRRKAGCWSVGVPFLSAFSRQLRGCLDRLTTAKQTAAMARAISRAKVSGAQCLWGFGVRSWRTNDHGQKLNRPFPGRPELELGGAAGRRGLKLAALSGRNWRELQIGGADCRPQRGARRRKWPAAIGDVVGGDPSWER
jgi:hypothetical protein